MKPAETGARTPAADGSGAVVVQDAIHGVRYQLPAGDDAWEVSREGTLAYRIGETGSRLVWFDRTGRELETLGDAGEYADPQMSPDASRLAFTLGDKRTARADLWVRDLARGVNSRLTFGPGDSSSAVWSPDGSAIAFRSTRDGVGALYQKPSNGQGEEKLLLQNGSLKLPTDWSRDGRYILYQEFDPKNDWGVWALPMFGDRKPVPVVSGPFTESNGVFSPDGHFVAYRSNESGRNEIYIQTFPVATGKWQVSNTGGNDPSWRPDGKEIIYRGLDQRIMSADVRLGQAVQVGVPQVLFPGRVSASGNARNRYTIAPDAKRLLITSPPGRDSLTPTTVVLNWNADLKR